jgi:hypothetical protein
MAYRIGMDDEDEKRRTIEESTARRRIIESQEYRKQYTGGGSVSGKRQKATIDLAQYQPTDIAELGYRMPAEQRAQFVDFAQGYYKKAGAQNIPKAEDISAQWSAWDAERDNTIRQNTIREKESTLGAGKSLNRIGTLSAIASMADGGEKDAAVSAYAELAGTIGSKYYNPYMSATSEPLKALGVESVDDAWFAQNADYVGDLLRDPITGKPTKPGNSATDAQKRAYSIYTLAGNEEQTKQAETELAALYEEIGAAAQYKGFDAVAYIEGIDWDEYPMLQKMREGEKTGAYPQLNRAVPLSVEGLYGAVYCAQKGIEVSDVREYEMYAGAWVNELMKQAKAGTNEEEPEGWLEKIGDFITGEAADREERIAQGAAAKATLEKLGVEMMEAPEEETEPEKYEQAQRTEELPEWVKKPTMESRVKSFQHGVYGFIENAQDRNALREIDAQIKTLEEQREVVRGEKNATLYGSQMATGYKGDTAERLTAIDEKISRLNAKKTRIAFAGSGETATKTNIMQTRQFAPGRTAGLEITPESAIDVLENYAQADAEAQAEAKNQNMQPPIGHGTTEWNMWYSASTDEMDAVYDAYDAAMARANEMDADARLDAKLEAEDALAEGTYRAQIREKVLRGLIPDDEETAAARAGADVQRISMLCEREVASALGDEETVAAINNQMIEAGYPTCWPEEEAIIAQERADSIEYAKGWGDDEVRKRLGIKDGRALTDDDYYEAAHTDKGLWDWLTQGWKAGEEYRAQPKKTVEEAEADLKKQAKEYAEKVAQDGMWETFYQEAGKGFYGGTGSVEQADVAADVISTPLAIAGGIMNAGANVVQGVTDTAEAFAFEAAKAQYGSNLTREQMALLSPGYKMVSDAKKATDTAVQTVAPDVSQRSGWVQTIGSLTETVVQNASLAKAGSVVGKINANFAKMLGIKDVAALQKVYQTSSNITRNMGFTLSGMKHGLSEAYAMGLDGAEAISYAITSAGISMAVENMSLDPLTKSSQVMNAMPDGAQAATKGWREFVKKTGRSALGEAMEEAVESPLQNIKTKILADPDMAWFGEGGVIDPGEMASGAALGFAAGAILGGVSEVGGRKLQKESTQTQESTSEEKPVENEAEAVQDEAEAVQDEVVDAQSATTTATGKVKKTPEQIARKAQDYAEIMEAAQDPDAGEDVIAFAQLAAEEVAQKGEMTDETRAQLRGMLGLKRLKTKMIMEDMANMARIIGSEATGAQTKAMAEEALSGMGNDGLDASTRKAVTQAAARDIAKAQAQAQTIEARKELEKATTDEVGIRKEYGQMNGRMVALNDNMSELIAQVNDGKANKEIQGQYQTLLSKTNTLQRRLENQKERLRDAQERKTKAQAAYDAAKAQAKADEEVIYEQIVNAGAKTEPEQAQTQQQEATQAVQPEAELDKATIEALEDGNEEKALGIQKAKESVKAQAAGAVKTPEVTQEQEETDFVKWQEEHEIFDRFEDYDVRGFGKYMKEHAIYIDSDQAEAIERETGLPYYKAGWRYGVRFTADKAKGKPLDGLWPDISGYFPGILEEGSTHQAEDLAKLLVDIKRNADEMKDKRNVFHSLRWRKKPTAGAQTGKASVELKTEQAIGEDLQRAFPGITVRGASAFGNLQIESGATDVESGSIRIVGHGNIADMAHEIGHMLSLKSGVNTAEYTAGGRVRPETLKVDEEKYGGLVDDMVETIKREDNGFFKHAEYATQEAKRQEAIAEFYNRYLEGGEDAARILAGEDLFEVLDGAMTDKQREALRQAHEDLSALDQHRTAIGTRNNVISGAQKAQREIANAREKAAGRLVQNMFDIYKPLIEMDKTAVESVLSGMSEKDRRRFIKLNKKRGGTNNVLLSKEQLQKYIETGELEEQDTEILYNIASNLAKAGGIVDVWAKDKIVNRRGDVLLETNIEKAVSPLEESELADFGTYHELLMELDARNQREEHIKAFYAAKAAAPEDLKAANNELSLAAKAVKDAQANIERYSKEKTAGAKLSLQSAQQQLADAIRWRTEATAARMAAEEKVKQTQGEYRPQTNDSYRSDWAVWTKDEVLEKIAKMESEYKHFKQVHDDMCEIYSVLMEEFMIKPGYIENAQTAWENVTKARPHYLPVIYTENKAVQEREIVGGINKAQHTIRSAKAGDKNIVNPVVGLIDGLHRMVENEGKMRLKNQMAFYYDTYAGMGEYLREITHAMDDNEVERAAAQGQNIVSAENMDAELLDLLASSGTKKAEGRVVIAIDNGQARQFEITDQHLYDALEHGKIKELAWEESVFKKTWNAIDNIFRDTTTLVNLAFGLKNVPRDALTGAVMTQDVDMRGRMSDYAIAMMEVRMALAKGQIKSELMRKFAAMGGLEGDAYTHDIAGERKRQRELLEMKKSADGVKKGLIEKIKEVNDITEAGRRYAEFRRGMKMGMTQERAFRMSQESTSDFSRVGLKSREATKYVYFGNAILQGVYDVIHVFDMEQIEPGRAQKVLTRAAVRVAGVSLAELLIRELFWDDEDKERYDNLAENYKRENFILFMPKGYMVSIPKGQNILFSAFDLPRTLVAGITKEARRGGDVYSYIKHELGTDMADWVMSMIEDIDITSSSVFRTAAVAAGLSNKNHFGDDVEPQWMLDERRGRQNITDEKTSVIANALSYFIPLSPKKIHYIIDQQGGWVGDLLLNSTTPSKGYQTWDESDGAADYVTALIGNTLTQVCSYLIKGYVRPSNLVSDLQSDFYDFKDFYKGAINQYEDFEGEDNQAWRNKNTMAMWLTDAQRKEAYEDAKDMEKYLDATQKAVKAKKEMIEKYPEEGDRFEQEIVQLLIAANHYAESWQRRYMDGDMSVQVIIPKVKEGNGK